MSESDTYRCEVELMPYQLNSVKDALEEGGFLNSPDQDEMPAVSAFAEEAEVPKDFNGSEMMLPRIKFIFEVVADQRDAVLACLQAYAETLHADRDFEVRFTALDATVDIDQAKK